MTNRAFMGMRDIGLNVNTLPVTAVGIGVGVDYAIYMLDRLKEGETGTLSFDFEVH
jgi:predicted RND superfamily exporter protein